MRLPPHPPACRASASEEVLTAALAQSKQALQQLLVWREQLDRQIASQQKQAGWEGGGGALAGPCERRRWDATPRAGWPKQFLGGSIPGFGEAAWAGRLHRHLLRPVCACMPRACCPPSECQLHPLAARRPASPPTPGSRPARPAVCQQVDRIDFALNKVKGDAAYMNALKEMLHGDM